MDPELAWVVPERTLAAGERIVAEEGLPVVVAGAQSGLTHYHLPSWLAHPDEQFHCQLRRPYPWPSWT